MNQVLPKESKKNNDKKCKVQVKPKTQDLLTDSAQSSSYSIDKLSQSSAHRLRETPKIINAHPESNNIDMVKSNRGRTTTVISTLGLEEINLSECNIY